MMRSAEQSPPSPTFPDCLETAQACDVCPFQVAAAACVVLAKSRETARLQKENDQLQEEVSDMQQRVASYAHDELTDFLLPRAVVEEIDRNEELRRGLQTGNWGIVWLDVRGLKWINDTVSMESGNELISTASSRLHDAVSEAAQHRLAGNTRSRPQKVAKNRRKSTSDTDLYVRSSSGGDEFAVLMLDISPEGLLEVEKRLKEVFSTTEAMKQDAKMQIPTIASVAICHASDPALGLSPTHDDYFTMYRSVSNQASKNHKDSKQAQYNEMETMVLAVDPDAALSDDTRLIAKRYFELFCPNLVAGNIPLPVSAR